MSSTEALRKDARPKVVLLRQGRTDTARQFLPAALEILETPASPVGRATGATIILFFLIAIVWASIGHVDIIATAPGRIVPTGRTKTVQPLEAGVVSAIHVRDGDHVQAGQVLIELDRTVSQAERRHIAEDLVASQLDVARLAALRDSFENELAPSELTAPPQAEASAVARARSSMRAQASEQIAKLASIDRQIQQKKAEAESTIAAIAKIDATLPLVEEQASIRRKAMEIQYGNRIAYLDAQTRFVDQQNERVLQQHKVVEIEAARQALEQEMVRTKAAYEHQVLSDLSDAEKKVAELGQDLIKADQKIDVQALRAPIEGTIQQLALHTVGGVVTPAQQLMVVVPKESRLEIEAMVSNRDIGFVSAGQLAEIKIDTFNFTRYGLLQGKVVSVSQDAIVQDRPNQKATNPKADGALSDSSEPEGQQLSYSARVSLDEARMQVENKMVNLAPGMAVTVEIKTGRRRIVEYVLSPLLRYRQESLRER